MNNLKIYDIAIVGSGILGISAAYHASKKGKKVLLIEAGKSPKGATVRNFGQVVPSGMAIGEWRTLGIRSLEIYRELANEFGLKITEQGSLYIASNDDEKTLIRELSDIDKQAGYESSLLSKEDCLKHIPALSKNYVKEGLLYPNEITLDSAAFIDSLITKLSALDNIDFLNSTKITEIEASNGVVELRAGNAHSFRACSTLICCGHRLNQLFPEILKPRSMQVCKLQMMSTKPMASNTIQGNLLTGLTIRRYESFYSCPSFNSIKTPEHLKALEEQGIHLLFKQSQNGELIIGDSHQYFKADEADSLDFYIEKDINELILEEAHNILELDYLKISKTWNGYYSQENEKGLLTKTIQNNIHIVTGIGGKGMTGGPALMEKIIATLDESGTLETFEI